MSAVDVEQAVHALPIPERGPVVFVLRMAQDTSLAQLHAVSQRLRAAAQEAAPGRGHGVVLRGDDRLEVLSEADLRRLGLARLAEPSPDTRFD